jgi:hypothetical protein
MAGFECDNCEQRTGVLVHLEYIRKAQDETNAHLKTLNGRTRKLEAASAVHSWALGIAGTVGLAALGTYLAKVF